MPRDRGIDKLGKDRFGNFLDLINKQIKKEGRVRILDAGCGFGVTMMGFVKKYGDKVEIIGLNYDSKSGDLKRMKKEAVKKGIFTKSEIKKIKNMPRIVYADASKKLPFKTNSFDFVYGQASLYLFDDKIHFLEECIRILKKGGLARFNSVCWDNKGMNSKKGIYEISAAWEIWDKGKLVTPEKYFRKVRGVKIGYINRKPRYLEVYGKSKINFGLKFTISIDTNFLWHEFGGVKSIYTTQLNFKPRYK